MPLLFAGNAAFKFINRMHIIKISKLHDTLFIKKPQQYQFPLKTVQQRRYQYITVATMPF